MNSKYIVRQPIKDAENRIIGYEIQYLVRIRHSAGEMVLAPAISPQQTPSTIS